MPKSGYANTKLFVPTNVTIKILSKVLVSVGCDPRLN